LRIAMKGLAVGRAFRDDLVLPDYQM